MAEENQTPNPRLVLERIFVKDMSMEVPNTSVFTQEWQPELDINLSSNSTKVDAVIKAGDLVSDDLIIDLVKERIAQPDCEQGCIFDGFPRTIPQAEALDQAGVKIDHVLEIAVPDESIIERMSGRRFHMDSGRSYHTKYNPPKEPGVDDVTGEPIIQREDDKPEVVKDRLSTYHAQTEQLVNFYSDQQAVEFNRVDGTQPIDEVKSQVQAILA